MRAPVRVLELRTVAGTGGGPDKTIIAGARLTPSSDVSVVVCYLCNHGDESFSIGKLAREAAIDYVEVRERHAFDPRTPALVRALIRDRQIQIVHSHDHKSDVLAFLLARLEPCRQVATAHGFTGHSWRERRVYYPLDRFVLSRVPKVIAVSSQLKTTLVKAGADPARVEVLLNGIEPDRFRRSPAGRAEARSELGFSAGDVVLGAVGRLEPQKRFDVLLNVFAEVRRSMPQARLVIAGDGSLRSALDRQIRDLQLDSSARLLGHVSDVRVFHHALDLFVQSSEYEGTPNVVLEAMAMETPLVATAVGGTDELVTHGVHGLIVSSGDAESLQHAIMRTLSDPRETAGRTAAARSRVEMELSFETRIRRLNEIYVELMSTAPVEQT